MISKAAILRYGRPSEQGQQSYFVRMSPPVSGRSRSTTASVGGYPHRTTAAATAAPNLLKPSLVGHSNDSQQVSESPHSFLAFALARGMPLPAATNTHSKASSQSASASSQSLFGSARAKEMYLSHGPLIQQQARMPVTVVPSHFRCPSSPNPRATTPLFHRPPSTSHRATAPLFHGPSSTNRRDTASFFYRPHSTNQRATAVFRSIDRIGNFWGTSGSTSGLRKSNIIHHPIDVSTICNTAVYVKRPKVDVSSPDGTAMAQQRAYESSNTKYSRHPVEFLQGGTM